MSEAYKVTGIVFALQIMVLVSTALLFNTYGGSLAHEVMSQDTKGYVQLAQSLLTDGQYHLPGLAAPETFRMPGYPFFIAVVFGLTNNSLSILLIVLSLVGAITSGLIYLISRELELSQKWAYSVAILFGISPAIIWIPATGMSDITFVFLLTLALYVLVGLKNTRRVWMNLCLLGLVLGLATLNRSVGLYLSPLFIGTIPFFLNIRYASHRALACIGVALITFSIPTLAWMARNDVVAGHFSLSSQFAFNPFAYNMPTFFAWKNHTSEESERIKLLDSVGTRDEYALVNGFTYSDRLAVIDKQFLKDNFISYGTFHLIKTLPFFAGSGVNATYATIAKEIPNMPEIPFFARAEQNTASLFYGGDFISVSKNLLYYWPATLERIVWLILFILAFTAPFITRGRQRMFSVLGVFVILTVAILATPIAQPRYRVPAEPFIWISAALALSSLMKRRSKSTPESQHDKEIQQNREAWEKKPLLRKIYSEFYTRILSNVRKDISGDVVEIGSGIGNFKNVYPKAIATDLFKNPWIDQVENAYHLSFADKSVSHLILFDVFHHLRYPGKALREFERVLPTGGRVIIFEPYISVFGLMVFGLFHHEPVALTRKISWFPSDNTSCDADYYAAQGNATRVFSAYSPYKDEIQKEWKMIKKEKISALSYILSGGFSRPSLYPESFLPVIRSLEHTLDSFPILFATRTLIILEKK